MSTTGYQRPNTAEAAAAVKIHVMATVHSQVGRATYPPCLVTQQTLGSRLCAYTLSSSFFVPLTPGDHFEAGRENPGSDQGERLRQHRAHRQHHGEQPGPKRDAVGHHPEGVDPLEQRKCTFTFVALFAVAPQYLRAIQEDLRPSILLTHTQWPAFAKKTHDGIINDVYRKASKIVVSIFADDEGEIDIAGLYNLAHLATDEAKEDEFGQIPTLTGGSGGCAWLGFRRTSNFTSLACVLLPPTLRKPTVVEQKKSVLLHHYVNLLLVTMHWVSRCFNNNGKKFDPPEQLTAEER